MNKRVGMNEKKDTRTPNTVNGAVWIERDGVKYFGPGPYELLQKVDATGSIHEAAREMGLSYRKAWMIISRLNKITGRPMVVTRAGGRQGGGSVVTADAQELMKKYRQVNTHFARFLSNETKKMN